jgi:serine/threonine-protein kinase
MPDPDSTADFPTRLSHAEPIARSSGAAPNQRFAAGSAPALADETCDLLHWRLRAAAMMLTVGFTVFLVRDVFVPHLLEVVIYAHAVVLLLLIATVAALSGRWKPRLQQLRAVELTMFGVVVAFFALGQYLGMQVRARQDVVDTWRLVGAVKSSIIGMLTVIFTYAIFIPNDWKRAARVIIPMALMPLIVPAVLAFTTPEFRALRGQGGAISLENISEHVLFMALGAVTAIFGTHTINTFRTEAFRARQLNQYRLGKKLGAGGMGEVYLAEHQLLKRPCAIKLIKPALSRKERVLARFELEVRATARLSHWNTVEVYDYGRTDDGTFYYVMEYLPGLSLQELVDRHGPLPPERVIYLLRQACDALHEAHQMGLIHRDLKPPNIFAAFRGGRYDVAKLLDFGLVKPTRADSSPVLTREGTVTGSPLYMAPEQIMQTSQADARTDLYGMGSIAYFLLTGQPPFMSNDAMTVMVAHARDPVVPPSRLRSGVPDDLEKVVLRCLEKNPGARFQDAHSLATALDSCTDASGWSPEQAALWWQAHEPAASIQEPIAEGTTQLSTPPVLAHSTPSSDEAPTLGASSIELKPADSSADGPGLSLTVAEDRARPDRRQ